MIMGDALVEGFGNLDHRGFFNVYLNLSAQASSFSPASKWAATAGI